jgi:phosphate/phosphite/phosphonate ABC transporter binding protein
MIPYSIGYTSLGDLVLNNPPVRVLSINGIAPTPTNLKDGRYKFIRPLGLILGRSPKAATMRFVNFIFSDTGSHILENSGYVPQRYEIVIGIVPEQNVMVQNQRYQPLVEYLSRRLGERFSVKLKLFSTYIEACRALTDGDINAAFLGSFAYATVHNYVDVLARPDYNGLSAYRGIIFVRADSGIEDIDDMKGKRLVMGGGRTTTAGYVFPLYYFKRHGINDYRDHFSEAAFVDTHEDAILAVLHNKADVGAAKDLIYLMLANENPALKSSLRILAQSPPVPSNAFVVRKSLSLPCFDCHHGRAARAESSYEPPSPGFNIGSTILQFLLDMPLQSDGKEALAALGNARQFLPTHDSDYAELYKMLGEIGVKPEDLLADSKEGSS